MIEPGTETAGPETARSEETGSEPVAGEAGPETAGAPAGGTDDPGAAVAGAAGPSEAVRLLEAEIHVLRDEIARRDAALATLGERLVPVEAAREEGRAEERQRRSAAEAELRKLQATRLYRLLLRPRNLLFRFRERRGTVE